MIIVVNQTPSKVAPAWLFSLAAEPLDKAL
jgi:hypothetical protein